MSTKAQYGLRALVEIGLRAPRAVPLKEVAEAQGISQHYLEQIAAQLRNAGFIRSVRGAKGGYRLARPPEKVTALEVVEAAATKPYGFLPLPGGPGELRQGGAVLHRAFVAAGGPRHAPGPRGHHPQGPH